MKMIFFPSRVGLKSLLQAPHSMTVEFSVADGQETGTAEVINIGAVSSFREQQPF